MSEHMKKHHIKANAKQMLYCLSETGDTFKIPVGVLEQYYVRSEKAQCKARASVRAVDGIPADEVFNKLDAQFSKAGVVLKGLRLREGLNQVEFAEMIDVTQGDLSKMERAIRPIGKTLAKRISKVFSVNYRNFL
jgi:DNA-binding XRE family transcriptional regulator